MTNLSGMRIIISRTDSIGDVMLTLPICSWIKSNHPDTYIVFLGKGYTRDIVNAFDHVDKFEDWDDYTNDHTLALNKLKALKADIIIHAFPNKMIARLAKKAGIPMRIGTSHRLFHLTTCNKRVDFTRKKSDLHESQLNYELLRPLGLKKTPELEEIAKITSHFNVPKTELPIQFSNLEHFTILHPKSQGSAKEWPFAKYLELAKQLSSEGKKVVFTGTDAEGKMFRDELLKDDNIIDTTGQLSLKQLMTLINNSDNLVACSTGPLHIAAYCGVNTVGLYSSKRPIHPGRWAAIGTNVHILVHDEKCISCINSKECSCIEDISIDAVRTCLK